MIRKAVLSAAIAGFCFSSMASENTFDFQLDTTEAKRALEVCEYDLTMEFKPPSLLKVVCNGAELTRNITSSGQKPIFDKVSTLNKSVLIMSQDVAYMKTFSPSTLRGHYNSIVALYTEEYLVELSRQADNLKLWEGYI